MTICERSRRQRRDPRGGTAARTGIALALTLLLCSVVVTVGAQNPQSPQQDPQAPEDPQELTSAAASVELPVQQGDMPAVQQGDMPADEMDERIPAEEIPTESAVLSSPQLNGWPISMNFVDTDIRDVARFFSTITGLNIVVDPEVSGPVTVNLFEVPWDSAFGAILRSHQLGFQVEDNIVRVASIDRLAQEAENRARLLEQEERAAPLRTVPIPLSYARAEELQAMLESQLSDRGEVMIDQRTNSMIIKDHDEVIEAVSALIETLDVPAPQVMIESRIVETTKDFSRELGIQWGFTGVADAAHGNTTGLVFPNSSLIQGTTNTSGLPGSSSLTPSGIGGTPFAVNLPVATPTSGVALTLGSILETFRLDVALTAMEEEGRGKIISSPKVTAQNNIQATIESGQKIPVQTLIDNTASITFINANLQLQVVPQITAERTIMLDIVVDKSEPDFQRQVLGIPTIFTRRAVTKVLVRDGGTTVIGGIFQMAVSESQRRVPFFHRIPLLGSLFKSNQRNQSNNELLIFITPRILE